MDLNQFKITRISDHGLELIKHFEGWVPHVYDDGAGIPTIGYGHALKPGEKFPNEITKEQGEELLRQDVAIAEKAVSELVTAYIHQHQFDALVSFVYNVGVGAFKSSTLLKKINEFDYLGAKAEFTRWNKATIKGKKVELAGLTKRRNKEAAMFGLPQLVLDPTAFLNLA